MKLRKQLGWFTGTLFVILCALFVVTWWRDGSEFFNESYGIDPVLLTIIAIGTEVLFNIGVAMMLFGSGMHKLTFKEIWNFDFEKVRFSGNLVHAGFWLNRIVSAVPSSYVLLVGFSKLPGWVNTLLFLELSGVVLAGFLIKAYLLEERTV